MNDLRARLQQLADAAAHHARKPEPTVLARRGRRRRRWRAGGVALLTLVVAGGVISLGRWTPRPTAATPAAPSTVAPCTPGTAAGATGRPCPPTTTHTPQSTTDPPPPPTTTARTSSRQARNRIVAQGTRHGVRWGLVAGSFSKTQVCFGLQIDGDEVGEDCTLRPVTMSWSSGQELGSSKGDKLVYGLVSPEAARVRLSLKRGADLNFKAANLPPVDAQLIDGGNGYPARFFLAFIPDQASVALAESFTAAGASLCRVFGDDFATQRLPVGCTDQPLPGG
jgi:hypothetical protein